MRDLRLTKWAASFLAVLFSPIVALGAAQLKAGAKTSAQPTAATGTSLRTLQITFDPVSDPTYNVTDWQFSVQFNSSLVSVDSVTILDPYTEPFFGGDSVPGFASTASTPATGYYVGGNFIRYISGTAAVGTTVGGDVNVFVVNFILNDDVNPDTDLLSFTILTDPCHYDFVTGTNPLDPTDTLTTLASPTTITNTYNGFKAQIAAANVSTGVPLPAGFASGLLGFAVVGAAYGFRRHLNLVA